jgi:hypothetical protein
MTDQKREQRRTPRIQPFIAPCTIRDGPGESRGFVVDLSVAGARIALETPLPAPGARVLLEVRFSRRPPMLLAGRVQWTRRADEPDRTHKFGVTFEDVSAEQAALLQEVIDEFQRRAAEL